MERFLVDSRASLVDFLASSSLAADFSGSCSLRASCSSRLWCTRAISWATRSCNSRERRRRSSAWARAASSWAMSRSRSSSAFLRSVTSTEIPRIRTGRPLSFLTVLPQAQIQRVSPPRRMRYSMTSGHSSPSSEHRRPASSMDGRSSGWTMANHFSRVTGFSRRCRRARGARRTSGSRRSPDPTPTSPTGPPARRAATIPRSRAIFPRPV